MSNRTIWIMSIIAIVISLVSMCLSVLTLSAPAHAATSGYNEFLSACRTKGSKPVCTCVAQGLRAKDVTEDGYRHLAKFYRTGEDDTSAEHEEKYNMLEEFDFNLATECVKNPKFKIQE